LKETIKTCQDQGWLKLQTTLYSTLQQAWHFSSMYMCSWPLPTHFCSSLKSYLGLQTVTQP